MPLGELPIWHNNRKVRELVPSDQENEISSLGRDPPFQPTQNINELIQLVSHLAKRTPFRKVGSSLTKRDGWGNYLFSKILYFHFQNSYPLAQFHDYHDVGWICPTFWILTSSFFLSLSDAVENLSLFFFLVCLFFSVTLDFLILYSKSLSPPCGYMAFMCLSSMPA